MTTQTAVRKPTEIQQAAINRCTDHATGEVFYTCKSDSQPDTWYQIRWLPVLAEWRCNCISHRPCKHERAVNEVLRAKAAEKQAAQERYLEFEAACGHYSIPGLY